MTITTIQLSNFGGHRALEAQMDAPVVGILGPNGAGKSTLLAAIGFAFTGELEDKADTYVFNSAEEKPPANAEVQVSFRKNGKTGTIYRRVGKSPKRWMEWGEFTGDKKLTRSDQIDGLLNEILSADKQAISNAIFLKQGDLDDLLFGDQPERERLFMKLMLLGHFGSREAAVDAQITRLGGMLQDVSAVTDEVQQQLGEVTQRRDTSKNLLASVHDWTPAIHAYSSWISATASVNSALQEVANAEAAITAYTTTQSQLSAVTGKELETWTGQPVSHVSIAGLLNAVSEVGTAKNTELLASDAAVREAEKAAARWNRLNAARTRITELRTRLQKVMKDIGDATESLSKIPEDIAALTQAKDKWINCDQALRDALAAEATATDAAKGLPAEEGALAAVDVDIGDLEKELENILLSVEMARLKVNMLDMANKSTAHTTGECCVLCDQPLHGLALGDLPRWRSKLSELEAELNKTRMSLLTKRQARENTVKCINKLKNGLEQARTATHQKRLLAEALPPPPEGDLAVMQKQVQERQGLKSSLEEKQQNLAQLMSDISAEESNYTEQDWSWLSASEPADVIESKINAGKGNGENLRKVLEAINTRMRALQAMISNDGQVRAGVENAKSAVVRAQAAEQTHAASAKAADITFWHLSDGTVANPTERKAVLVALAEQRARAQGALVELETQVTLLTTRLLGLREQLQRQEKVRLTLDKLRMLKRTFNRQGLPATYLHYRFEQLTGMTQENLSLLGANFTVYPDPDPEQSMSFIFQRLDDPSVLPLPQNKLSGGQRVRLTLAFLLAVQQLILPEVGFLVLDEPTTHMDEAGKDSLRDLFREMCEHMRSKDAQLVVCDHYVGLAPAFGRVVTLNGPVVDLAKLPAAPGPPEPLPMG